MQHKQKPRQGKSSGGRYRGIATAIIAGIAIGAHANAGVQSWDPMGTGSSGGSGTWDAGTTLIWDTGATPSTAWVNGNDAVFNGATGTVTVSGTVGIHNLTTTIAGYTFNGGTLNFNGSTPQIAYSTNSGTLTINSVIAGSAGLTLLGGSSSYNFALNGSNTFTGGLVINQATATFNTFAADGTNSSFGSSGTVQIGAGGSAAIANYTGSGGGTTGRLWTIGGTSTSDGVNNNSSNASGGALIFTNTGIATAGTVGARTVNLGGTYNVGANTFAESITDLGTGSNISALNVKAGQWILSGTSSNYTGATSISSNTLIGGIGAHVFGNTSTINLTGSSILSLLGDSSTSFTKAGDGTTLYSVTTSGSGAAINVDDATAAGASVVKTMTIGAIGTSSTAASGVTFNFTGADNTSLITGTLTGPVTASAGIVTISNQIPIATGTLTLAGYTSANTTGGETLIIGNSGNTTITGAITPGSTPLLVAKTGSNQLTLSGSSTYSGGTNISAGTLNIAQSSSLGTGTVNFTTNSAILNAAAGLTLTNAVSVPASTTAIFKNSAASGAGSTFQIGSLISGAGSVLVSTPSNFSNGPIELSNDSNSFTGTFSTGFGFVEYTSVANSGANSALGAGSTSYTLGNSTSAMTFQYIGSANDTTTRAINWTATSGGFALDASGAGTVGFLAASALRSGAGNATLTLQGFNTGPNTLGQAINNLTGGVTTVNKSGAGTWVLTGTNSYSGGTNISNGKLVVNGSGTLGTGTATINGGVLAGNGSTGTAVVINRAGTITAGSGATSSDTIATLTTNIQTWNPGGNYVAKVSADGLSNDTLVMSGLSIAASTGTNAFNINVLSQSSTILSTMQQLVLAFIPGASQGNFNTSAFNLTTTNVTTPANTYLALTDAVGTFDGVSGDELITETVGAPEPTSALLLGATAAPLLLTRRRRRVSAAG